MKSLLRQSLFLLPMAALSLALVAHAQSTTLNNPLSSSLSSIPSFFAAALHAMVEIAVPIITVAIVYSGALFVFAQGNQAKLEVAKRNFFYCVIGALFILSAQALSVLLANTASQLLTN